MSDRPHLARRAHPSEAASDRADPQLGRPEVRIMPVVITPLIPRFSA